MRFSRLRSPEQGSVCQVLQTNGNLKYINRLRESEEETCESIFLITDADSKKAFPGGRVDTVGDVGNRREDQAVAPVRTEKVYSE